MDSVGIAVLIVLIIFIAHAWIVWGLRDQLKRSRAALLACESRERKRIADGAARYFVKRAADRAAANGAATAADVVNDSVGLPP